MGLPFMQFLFIQVNSKEIHLGHGDSVGLCGRIFIASNQVLMWNLVLRNKALKNRFKEPLVFFSN